MKSDYQDRKRATSEAFDRASKSYDSDFSRSALGQVYRERVHQRLDANFKPGMLILDIGCGTGEDAIHLARRGISVMACDLSAGMLNRAEDKIKKAGVGRDIELRQISAEDLACLIEELPMGFDGVFSNFGPVNMIQDLDRFARITARLIDPGCKCLHVVMSRKPFFETMYFLTHLRFRRAFARWDGKAHVPVGPNHLPCKFYQPYELMNFFEMYFSLSRVEALGLLLPPPYLSGHYRRRKIFYRTLTALDRNLSTMPGFNALGDHFIIELTREPDKVTYAA